MLTNFVTGTLNQFIAKYTHRAQAQSYAPTVKPVSQAPEGDAAIPATDRVDVSPEAKALANQQGDASSVGDTQEPDETQPKTIPPEDTAGDKDGSENDDEAVQPGTTTVSRQVRSEAEIRIRMRFSLRSISAAISRLESGELDESEALNVVQSALSVRMKAKGYSVTDTRGAQTDANVSGSAKLKFRQRAMAHYGLDSGDTQLRGFYREAFKLRQSLKVEQQGTHQRVINRFAMRYRFDARFSMQHLSRFNSSTEAVAQAHPEALSSFLNASDQVAAGGSQDTVATFFDTVESFMDGAEDQLLDKVSLFIDAAASQMGGVSGEMAMLLEDQITTRVESFFDRVSDALSQLEATYLPEENTQPLLPVGEPELLPEDVPPTVNKEGKATLAVA